MKKSPVLKKTTALNYPLNTRPTCRLLAPAVAPDYGVYDFRKYVRPYTFKEPFPCAEEVWYQDLKDDDPIWGLPGIAIFGDHGCGATFGIELNGQSPGQTWPDRAEARSPRGTLIEFYQKWLDKVESGLAFKITYEGRETRIFRQNPGRVVVDENDFVLSIELFDKCSIT